MDRRTLLKRARAMGFTGKTLGELTEWADTEGVQFAADASGKTLININEAWNKTVYITADAGESVEIVTPDGGGEMDGEMDGAMADEEEKPVAKRRPATARDIQKSFMGSGKSAPGTVRNYGLAARKKAYDRSAAQGGLIRGKKPIFSSSDEAEYFGAAFRLATAGMKGYSRMSEDKAIIGTKAGSTFDNTYAGALIVHETAPQIIDLLHEYGAVRQLAGVTAMPDGEYTITRKTANMSFSFVDEAGAISETNPTVDSVKLVASKLAGIAKVSNELLNDSAFDIADLVATSSVAGAQFAEDSCYFNGTGLGNFTGLAGAMDSDSTYDAALASSWSDYTIDKLQNWVAMVPVEAFKSGTVKIACSQAFYMAVLRRFALSAGGNVGNSILDGVGGGYSWDGIPVVISQILPSIYQDGQKVAYIGSFERGTKFGVVSGSEQLDSSDQAYWANDQFGWRFKERIAFNTHDCGGTSSEVIALQD